MNDNAIFQTTPQSNAEQDYCLSSTAYSFGYILRQKHSTLKLAALEWFAKECLNFLPVNTSKMLSLGCGNGLFDIEFIKTIQKYNKIIDFTGLDFNEEDISNFHSNLSDLDTNLQKSITLEHGKFDPFVNRKKKYDIITMVHFLHSFDNVLPVIENAIRHLSPGGKLLIIQTGEQGVFALKQKFLDILPNHKFQSSENIKSELETKGIPFSSYKIDTYLDVSIMNKKSIDALLLMSFCFSNDLSILDTEQQEKIQEAFLSLAQTQENGRLAIYEPMEAIICEAT